MIYRIEDYQATKPVTEDAMADCMFDSAGVFGDEVYAVLVTFAMQQVYDRYSVWFRLTRGEYDAFPHNRDALLPLMDENSPRILLRRGGMSRSITAFDSNLLGPTPLGHVSEAKR